MIKLLLTSSIVVGILSALSALIPATFTAEVDSAILYFLGWIKYTDILFDPAVVLNCIRIISNMLMFSVLFIATKKIYQAMTR